MSAYNATDAKYDEVSSNSWTIYDYADISTTDVDVVTFREKVDISVAGVIMDCGECHVGGGGMEYVPFSNLDARTPLRNLTTGPDAAAQGLGNTQGAVSVDDMTAFNFFIDTYDVDRDGNEQEAMYIDYANTGVMEMDCLLCHLPGYNYGERTYLLRRAKIDATRAVAAGFATENDLTWNATIDNAAGTTFDAAPAGYGTTVNYITDDPSMLATDIVYTPTGGPNAGVEVSYAGTYAIPGEWFNDNIAGLPASENCAFCHMSKPAVDWKKRGDNWPGTYTQKYYDPSDSHADADGNVTHTEVIPVDGQYEVHVSLGCMGCHERKPTAAQPGGYDYLGADGYATQGSGLLGHDPAKGAAPFSSLYNANDKAAFKSCADCHINGTGFGEYVDTDGDLEPDTYVETGQAYGAPNPNAAHAAYGLTANIVQAVKGDGVALDGTPSISHIDLMACSTCHSRKVDDGTWHNNGNPMVDASGNDLAGRLTDHEGDAVIKEDMTDNSGLSWVGGKLIRASYLNTMFYRDNGGNTTFDANRDGRGAGMDAILMTQVNKMNEDNGWTSLTGDNYDDQLGTAVITPALINARIGALNAVLDTWVYGVAGPQAGDPTSDVKLSMMHVAFKDQHGVSPAAMAWGSGRGNDPEGAVVNANPCLDCHSSASNFWNGSIKTVGDATTIYWDNDVVAFTKVNGMTQPTDMHPNVKDRFAKRSLASRVTTATMDVGGEIYNTTEELPIAKTVYEDTFMTSADFGTTFTSSGAIGLGGDERVWFIKVQVNDGTDVITRTKKFSANIPVDDGDALTTNDGIPGLLANLGTFATDFEFTISDNGSGGITFTADTGYTIRLHPLSAAGPLQLVSMAYKSNPWTAIYEAEYEAGNAGFDGEFNTRAEWVDYLNTLFVDPDDAGPLEALTPADFGIGQPPVATISSVPATVEVGSTVDLIADETVNAGTVSYGWICNDTADETLEGATVAKTFDAVGTWTVTLKVIDEEGQLAQVHQDVVVTPAISATIGFAPGTEEGTGVSTAQTVTFNNLPAGDEVDGQADQLYIIWGDGDREVVTNATNNPVAQSVTHQFRAYDMYLNGGNYEYNIIVRAEDVIEGTDMWGNPTTETVILGTASFTFTVTDDIP